MERIQDIRTLHKMNKDVEDRQLQPHEVRSKLNLRSGGSERDNAGVIEKIKGNLEKGNLQGTVTVIGSCVDENTQSIIFFVHEASGYHRIVRYNPYTDSTEIIIDHDSHTSSPITMDVAIMNFNKDYPIQARVLDDFLIWIDNYNPARIINIPRMRNTVTNTGTGTEQYHEFNEDVITFGATPPMVRPELIFHSDPTFVQNNLRKNLFQFCYRYVYLDKSKSVTSPLSKINYPQLEETAGGTFTNDYTTNNSISVDIEATTTEEGFDVLGNSEVEYVEFFVRKGFDGYWQLFDRIYNYDESGTPLNPQSFVVFYNNKVGETVDQNEINRVYHDVPQKQKALDIVDDRMVFGNFVSGHDNIDLDVELKTAYTPRDYESSYPYTITASRTKGLIGGNPSPHYDLIFPDTVNENELYRFTIKVLFIYDNMYLYPLLSEFGFSRADKVIEEVHSFQHIVSSEDTPNSVANYFVSKLNETFPTDSEHEWVGSYDSDNKTLTVSAVMKNEGEVLYQKAYFVDDLKLLVFNNDLVSKYPTWKAGSYKDFGIIYYGKNPMTVGAVNTQKGDQIADGETSGTTIYVPSYDVMFDSSDANYAKMHSSDINFKIYHRPPKYAYYWQWVVNERQPWFIQLPVSRINKKPGTNFLKIDVSSALLSEKNMNPDLVLENYSFEEGDRLRIVRNTAGQYPSEYVETEIKGVEYTSYIVDENGDYILDDDGKKIPDTSTMRILIDDIDLSNIDTGQNMLVEIYRPQRQLEEDRLYKTVGPIYGIYNAEEVDRVHMADDTNQSFDLTTPAQGTIQGHDAFVRPRILGSYVYALEAQNFSDYYQSKMLGYGKSFVVNRDMKQERFRTGLKIGGKYFQGTNTNELQALDFGGKYLDNQYGDIYHLTQIGYTLKVKQLHKNVSIYVGRQEIHNADGSSQLMTSQEILGNVRPPIETYGTPFPESVCVNERHSYFYDPYHAAIIRDSANGMVDISEAYHIKNWLRNQSTIILNSGITNVRVVSVFDEEYNELVISFIHGDDAYNDTIVFHEPTNSWTYHASYIPEHMESIGTVFVSFKNGKLWRHNVNSVYNSFYDTVYPSSVEFVGNKGFQHDKEFKVLKIDGTGDWYANYGDIKVPASKQYPRGMESRLLAGEFKLMNSEQVAAFNKNSKTSQTSNNLKDLINGEDLRGKLLKVKLRNDSESYESINLVNVESQIMK